MGITDDILTFWLDEIGPAGWYRGDAPLDREIKAKFESVWTDCQQGGCGLWLTDRAGTLAYIILCDQFTRNMFRGDARSFASDKSARAATKIAIDKGWDMATAEPERHFFYMPLMHSENLIDQDRSVALIGSRLPDTGASNFDHAKVHRDIIREFGRFPFRNKALGRTNTPVEQRFLDNGGYGAAFRSRDQSV